MSYKGKSIKNLPLSEDITQFLGIDNSGNVKRFPKDEIKFEPNVMIVTFHYNPDREVIQCDKTFSEIVQAIDDGKTILGVSYEEVIEDDIPKTVIQFYTPVNLWNQPADKVVTFISLEVHHSTHRYDIYSYILRIGINNEVTQDISFCALGSLNDLSTDSKDSIVSAINEINRKVEKEAFVLTYDSENGLQHEGEDVQFSELIDLLDAHKTLTLFINVNDMLIQSSSVYYVTNENILAFTANILLDRTVAALASVAIAANDSGKATVVSLGMGTYNITVAE